MRVATSRRLGLTEPQAVLLAFIKEYIEANRRPASYREMRDAVGVKSVSAIQSRLKGLIRHELVQNLGGTRGIVPIQQ
jgi:SOS-response transcriptional repressor LexA